MLVELNKSEYFKINSIDSLYDFPIIQAVVQKIQQGTVFAKIESKQVEVFVLCRSGFGYYYNSSQENENSSFINFIYTSTDLPSFFHLFDPPKTLELAKGVSDKFNVRQRKRITLQYKKEGLLQLNYQLTSDYYISEVTENNFDKIVEQQLINDKYWNSKVDFLKYGVGYCIFDKKHNPLSICYSACVVNGIAEIDVKTIEEYRQMGFAKIVTGEYINRCKKKKLIPNWDCFEENVGSLKTALGLGFSRNREYNFLTFYKKETK